MSTFRNSPGRYGLVAQTLHWSVMALIAVQYVLGHRADDLPAGLARLKLLATHKSLGITILALALARLAWRLYDRPPPLPAAMPAWERHTAGLTHAFIYLLLFAVPLAGWAASSAGNHPVSWFGLVAIPSLVASDTTLRDLFVELHENLNRVLLAVVVLHAAAALRHHFMLKDGVLRRMLPGRETP